MKVKTRKYGHVTVFFVSGTIDTLSAPSLQVMIQQQLTAGNHHYVIDFETVRYVSSAGVRALIYALQETRRQNGDLRLSGASAAVDSVLELTGLKYIMNVYPNFLSALTSYRSAPQPSQ